MRQHITRTPPPLPAQIPPAISALVMEMLEKEAGKRPSMQEVLSRLDALQLQGVTSTAVHTVPSLGAPAQRRLAPIAAAAVLALVVLGLGLWLALRSQASAPRPAPPSKTDAPSPLVEHPPIKKDVPPARPTRTAKPVKKIKRGSDLFPDRDSETKGDR